MKIAIVSNLYPPLVRGGAEIIAQTMAEGLHEALQNVFIVTTKRYSGLASLRPEKIQVNGITVYRFYPLNIYHYTQGYTFPSLIRSIWHILDIFNFHSYLEVKRIFLHEQPDVVITHNLMGLGFMLPRLCARLHIKQVHVLHDVQLYNPTGIIVKRHEDTFLQRVCTFVRYPQLMDSLFASVRDYISPSLFLKDFYLNKGFFKKAQVRVLENPVILPASVEPKVPGRSLRLLYLGQISESKGVLGLIDIIKSLQTEEIELRIVGSGADLLRAVKAALPDKRIVFFGWRSLHEIDEMMSTIDALILPTLCYDNSPTVVFEALSRGIPVIASDIGGAKEIVTHGKNGWLFEAGNWESLKLLIGHIARNREEISRVAYGARASVEDLSVKQYCMRLLTLLQSLKR